MVLKGSQFFFEYTQNHSVMKIIIYPIVYIPHLQAVQTIFELPLDFQSEAIHNKSSNWELAADIVNITSKVRRSGRQVSIYYVLII